MTILIVINLNLVEAFSQVNLNWSACYNGEANDYDASQSIFVDGKEYVYITGASRGVNSDFDYVTIKYDKFGNQLWVSRIDKNNQFNVPHDITANDSGFVYVTGGVQTLKYNSEGNLIWSFNNDAECFKIAMYDANNIIVCGNGYDDYRTLKISSEGNLIWYRLYNGTAQNRDNLRDMTLDSKGNIIVTGWSHGSGTHWDYATVKYSPDGDSLWVRRYNGPSSLFPGDYAYAITVDDEDNVYVTGWSDGSDSINNNAQCLTISYNSNGDTLWISRYPGQGYAGYDVLYTQGFIYVAATSYDLGVDLLKYDKQGNLVWSNNLFPSGSPIHPPRLVSDNKGNIYVSSVRNLSYAVVKVSSSGSKIWEFQYPNTSNPGSFVRAMTIDKNKNIYLTGESIGWVCPGDDYDFLTLKISQEKVGVHNIFEVPFEYKLSQNYPNPFNPVTTIEYELAASSNVKIKIYNLLGEVIETLVNSNQQAGKHFVQFDGSKYSSGIYCYELVTENFTAVKKLVLVK